MKNRENLEEELRDLSPFLADLKKQGDGLKVPEGYFDQFEGNLFQKMKQKGIQRTQAGGTNTRHGLRGSSIKLRYWMAAAACIAMLLAAFWFFQPARQSEFQPMALGSEQLAATISQEELEAYVLENVHEFDSEQLASLPEYESSGNTRQNKELPHKKRNPKSVDVKSEDITPLLDEMSEEELEQLL